MHEYSLIIRSLVNARGAAEGAELVDLKWFFPREFQGRNSTFSVHIPEELGQ